VTDISRTIDALWRIESPRIIGSLARIVRDVGLAEELAQDALVTALEQWPEAGIPENPAAWLMLTAKRRAIDRFRRSRMMRSKNLEIARDLEAREDVTVAAIEASLDDDIGDERLSLIFTACHPLLSPESRAALTLRLMGGLTTGEIARAYLTSEPAIAQRITRAKKTLGDASLAFEVPHGAGRAERLNSVLEVLYLIFNEGYAATSGENWMRPILCDEAIRLGRIVVGLAPDHAEAHGLLALMELQASRLAARSGPEGEPILLLDQDRTRWDRTLIGHGLAALDRANAIPGRPGPFRLQAGIAACHARATRADETDWRTIAELYEHLYLRMPSPIVALNHAVAIGMVFGPEKALELIAELQGEPALESYHLLPAVRGEFLERLGRFDEARAEFARAAELAKNKREHEILSRRAGRKPL
jgi:RNA polymerase sigma factor (sigma-70 family)